MQVFNTSRALWVFLWLLVSHVSLFSQKTFTEIPVQQVAKIGQRFADPSFGKVLRLDETHLLLSLATAPRQDFGENAKTAGTPLELPMPDGTTQTFYIVERPVMHPDLQAKYPEIRCFTGFAADASGDFLKCEWTPTGFHAMIWSSTRGTIAIDPLQQGDKTHYLLSKKETYRRLDGNPDFQCSMAAAEENDLPILENSPKKAQQAARGNLFGDCKFRKYRLALSATLEYTAFHGGTKPLALAAMNTTMNRVNGVYEKELAITMEIIPNNDTLIFLPGGTDPFSNGSGGQMLGQNQTTVTSRIGAANYDIGHVFSTGGGGIAGFAVVCKNTEKAQGVTGQGQPIGDFFDIDYVAHEMGHQFGANHTFYNSCSGNKNASTAFEPGSGATIMAYAGICSPNVQNNSDDYFHAISLQEIGNYVSNNTGGSCPVTTVTGNQGPIVQSVANRSMPISTPFALTAVASDPDGDPLTYCWEQMNATGQATQPPVATNTLGPNFRSRKPVNSPTRFFPTINNVLLGTTNTWEVLPSVTRTMNFQVTVRDNKAIGGCTASTNVALTFTNTAGPFLVTEPNTNVLWYVGENKEVTWAVANTNAAPVSCSLVRILLSTDGGQTFPTVLADNVPNNGSMMVTVPNLPTTTARIKVEAIGNYFYDLSNQNFRIEAAPSPTFFLATSSAALTVCAGQSSSLNLTMSALLGFSDMVNFSISGLTPGITANFSPNPSSPSGTVVMDVTANPGIAAGTFPLVVTATAGSITRTANINLTVLSGIFGLPNLQSPANGSQTSGSSPTLTWTKDLSASGYSIELATSPAFQAGSIIFSGPSATNLFALSQTLNPGNVYYWRVRSTSFCGAGNWTETFAFQVGGENCGNVFSSTGASIIPSNQATTVTNSLLVNSPSLIEKIRLNLNIEHSWVGDLSARLIAPDGTSALLFDRPGVPATQYGCDGNNITITIEDNASNTAADLEDACAASTPSISGSFRSIELLSIFQGKNVGGTWGLEITDAESDDGGMISSWNMDVCFPSTISPAVLVTNQTLTVVRNGSGLVDASKISAQVSGNPGQIRFTLRKLPTNGLLYKNGLPLGVGDFFTQADVNASLIAYTHDGNNATSDSFSFDVLDTNNNGWLDNRILNIVITQNALSGSLAISQEILCAASNTGIITATPSGGTPPFSFSLNGSPSFQASAIFNGLSAGSYTITIRDQEGTTIQTNSVNLVAPLGLVATAQTNGNNLTVNASGGTGNLEYSLNGGAFQANSQFLALSNGNYTVVVRDANGCTTSASAVISIDALLSNITIQNGISCHGSSDASIRVEAAGGLAPYSYSLAGGATNSTGIFANLPAGTYSAQVTDAAGSVSFTPAIDVVAPALLSLNTQVNINSVTLTAAGGTGNYLYAIQGQTATDNPTFEGLSNGTFTFVVTDANGCFAFTDATVTVLALSGTANVLQAPLCANLATGSVELSATGGFPPYTYRLGSGAFQNSPLFTQITPGTYNGRVRDSQGTVVVVPVTISAPPALMFAGSAYGSTVTLSANGGTPPYSYSWAGGNTQTDAVFTQVPNGNYIFMLTDANGCSDSIPVTVNLPALGIAIINEQNILCHGEATGSFMVAFMGGLPPLTFSLAGFPNQTSGSYSGLSAGTYTVTATDDFGQTAQSSITLTESPAIVAATNLTANNLTINATGGVAPYLFSINGGAAQASGTFNNLPGGQAVIRITDSNDCVLEIPITIPSNPLQLSTTTVSSSLCAGDLGNEVRFCFSGGTKPYTIQLNPMTYTSFLPVTGNCDSSMVVSGWESNSYTLEIQDAEGFQVRLPITITEPSALLAAAEIINNSILVNVSGGTPGYTYALNGALPQSSGNFENLSPGNYTVLVTDANGCTTSVEGLIITSSTNAAEAFGQWKIAPNPSTGIVRIEFGQYLPDANTSLSVYDPKGRLLYQDILGLQAQNSTILDLSFLPTGVYFLRIRDGYAQGALRLVIVE